MTSCRCIHPLLHRSFESELSAEESLRLARHLPECTACRIRLARERRLAQLMDAIEDNLQVDDSFADGVMADPPVQACKETVPCSTELALRSVSAGPHCAVGSPI